MHTDQTTQAFADDLLDILGDHIEDELNYGDTPISSVRDFKDAGIMTYNAGLVVTLGDGTEFQITIVQSR